MTDDDQTDAEEPPIDRDANVSVRVNQLGYPEYGAKRCVTPGTEPAEFEVRRLPDDEVVHRDAMRPAGGDFDEYLVGAFDPVTTPGTYYVSTDSGRSRPFEVGADVYDDLQEAILSYFGKQRCGPSETGYLTPCHCDDGLRRDNGEYQDVTGGWHDATDLRKWVGATINPMVAFADLLERPSPIPDERLEDGLRWGNRYFLSMQEPEGYLMRHVGGDLEQNGDGNRWTNNAVEEPDGEYHLTDATGRDANVPAAVFGTTDDRVIDTDPVNATAQLNFVTAAATMAGELDDDEYAASCLDAAESCFDWVDRNDHASNPAALGTKARAAVALHEVSDNDYRERAAEAARRLAELQVTDCDELEGYFRDPDGAPFRDNSRSHLPFLGLVDLLEAFPDHDDAPAWRETLERYVYGYLTAVSERNAFGIVPYGLYDEDPGGGRPVGDRWFRYFMVPDGYWTGMNATLAIAGLGLVRAARVLDDEELVDVAQRQFDWILGANPLAASTVEGFGYNHPERYMSAQFTPQTPRLRGAVMNGLGGDEDDFPAPFHGSYHTAEYWTPMVAYTLLLAAELRAGV